MPTIPDTVLAGYAPNVVVSVGTPPVYTPSVVPGSSVSQMIFQKIKIDGNIETIDKDTTLRLADLARYGNMLTWHIKFYGNYGNIVETKSTTTTAAPPPFVGPPRPLTTFTTGDARDLIPDISEAPSFETILYIPQDLVGLMPPDNPKKPTLPPPTPPADPGTTAPPTPTTTTTPPKNPKTWSPLELSSLPYFNFFPSAIYVPAIQSCISAPYFAPEAKRHLNGVLHSANNPIPGETCYLWEVDRRGKNREYPDIRPRIDGAIVVGAQRKDSNNPYADIYLQPYKWERKFGIDNGKHINAFSLILGIEGGGNENQPQAAIWSIDIIFGDITLKFNQGVSGVSVIIKAGGSSIANPQKIEIQPSTAAYVTDNFGERPYILTFIPVWNGILMSHGVPASSDWGSTITYFRKDDSLNVNTQISEILNVQQTKKQKEKGINPFPPKIKVKRGGKYYNAPGVFVKGKKIAQVGKEGDKNYKAQSISNSDFNTGDQITVKFHRCGGVFKFVPVWFTPYSRYHYLYAGAADPGDIPQESPTRRPPKKKKDPTGAKSGGGPRPLPSGDSGTPAAPKVPPSKADDPTTIPSNPDVFQVPSKHKKLVMPILHFGAKDDLDFRVHLATIVKSASKPFSCLSMEFRNVNPDVRRPIQVWGAAIAVNANLVTTAPLFPPSTDEGFLTVNDLPALRIRRFSISRSLDGANGEIVWDRTDPIQGLLPRPSQRIGALRVALTGGANTIPGIVFTGIALGNSQEDTPDENHVRIPLRGREAKLDSDGGISLWNCPVFDGWDHRDAMAFLANYGGVPIDSSLAQPFNLVFSANIDNPILFILGGTGVNQAMDTVTKESMSLYYFDRFGTLIHTDSEVSTGRNWIYPDVNLESFSDEPDFQWMRNELIVLAQVSSPGSRVPVNPVNGPANATLDVPVEVVKVRIPISTIPNFPWARQAVYQIPNILPSRGEVIRLALRYAEARGRPRATSRCQIPPNANIELLDTINDNWIITSISHEADTQTKKWTMSLGVELFVAAPESVGAPIVEIFSEKT